ncbi:hypothetical protein J2752_002683 [Halarchaeum rubridurum]|nr:hypothetical protein [Halarchaeum rubridurum]MBP1955754.1 hypothetical protein [Halarchaeum rubridurum]
MPELDIGASQAEYIEELREALADEYLDGYGAMRPRDALQYLIDRHEATRPADDLVPAAASSDDAVAGTGDEAGSTAADATTPASPSVDDAAAAMLDAGEPDASEDSVVGESEALDAAAGSASVETVRDDAADANATTEAETEPASTTVSTTSDGDGDGDPETAGDDATTDTDSATSPSPSPSPSGSGSPLRQMMELLEEHDDAWEEVDSSDGKYRVTLPDGSTEHARTRDDVRALLFKHYR